MSWTLQSMFIYMAVVVVDHEYRELRLGFFNMELAPYTSPDVRPWVDGELAGDSVVPARQCEKLAIIRWFSVREHICDRHSCF